ncbi:hypothetical protein [Spirillospora sp. NPDC029432]|uniref:hypothetical protein n=1 Tax=Spirillospora sp. NPDC029432 TaxID=3154599 RepID=UPI0034555E7F
MRFHEPDDIDTAADDFREWRLRVEDPRKWLCFAKCFEALIYVHADTGTVATVSAWDLKAGRLRLRPLAGSVLDFFAEYAIGPKHPIILEDPAAQPLLPTADDEWIQFLLTHGFVTQAELTELGEQWAAQYVPPLTPQIPDAWRRGPASDLERSLRRKVALLEKVDQRALQSTGAIDDWNLNHLGFGVDPGIELVRIPEPTESLYRVVKMLGPATLGPIQLHTEDRIIDQTGTLPRRLAKLGLDPDDAHHWFDIGTYHLKAALLLHRVTGQIAGLEPSPSNRLRPLHDDVFGFIDEYGLGLRHPELCYNPRSRPQATAARQWLDFLRLFHVLETTDPDQPSTE